MRRSLRVHLEGLALLRALALALRGHHEVLILLKVLPVVHAGAATLLAFLQSQVHHLVGFGHLIGSLAVLEKDFVVVWRRVLLEACIKSVRLVVLWLLVVRLRVRLRGRPLPTLLLLHFEMVVLDDVRDGHVARLFLILDRVLEYADAIQQLVLLSIVSLCVLLSLMLKKAVFSLVRPVGPLCSGLLGARPFSLDFIGMSSFAGSRGELILCVMRMA